MVQVYLTLLAGICGLELCAAGFGSFVYHAHGTALTGFLDLGLACVLLLNLSLYGLLFFVDVYAHWIPLNFLRLAIVVVGMGLGGWVSCKIAHKLILEVIYILGHAYRLEKNRALKMLIHSSRCLRWLAQ